MFFLLVIDRSILWGGNISSDAAASLCDGDGGETDIGERDAAYCELAHDIAGEPLVEDIANGEQVRMSPKEPCCAKDEGEMGEYGERSVDPEREAEGRRRLRAAAGRWWSVGVGKGGVGGATIVDWECECEWDGAVESRGEDM